MCRPRRATPPARRRAASRRPPDPPRRPPRRAADRLKGAAPPPSSPAAIPPATQGCAAIPSHCPGLRRYPLPPPRACAAANQGLRRRRTGPRAPGGPGTRVHPQPRAHSVDRLQVAAPSRRACSCCRLELPEEQGDLPRRRDEHADLLLPPARSSPRAVAANCLCYCCTLQIGAQQGDIMDLNLMPEEEDEAQQGDIMDLNLMPEEEDEAQ